MNLGQADTRPPSAATALAHLSALNGLPGLLRRLGVEPEPVIREAGFEASDFDDPDRATTFADFDRLLDACLQSTHCPHLGLLLGASITLNSFGLAGRLASTAPTVGEALRDFASSFVLHDSGTGIGLAVHDGVATLSYGIHMTDFRHEAVAQDLAAVGMLNVMRQLCGESWQPLVICLPRKRPADLRPYRDLLTGPLRFNAVQTSVQFTASWLDAKAASADPVLRRVLHPYVVGRVERVDASIENQVRRAIHRLLPSNAASRSAVARELQLHPRTLVRRLAARNTSFQALYDEIRAHMAKRLLQGTPATVSQVAARLGYRDATVFIRAFRRWTGSTPGAFRVQASDR